MNRIEKRVKIKKKTWLIKSLFPADFLSYSFWPFSYYRLPEDLKPTKQYPEVKRDWKIKPKNLITQEEKLNNALRNVYRLGAGIYKDKVYDELKADEFAYQILLAEIYSLSYGLTNQEKLLEPFKVISRDFGETIYMKAKAMYSEPWNLIGDITELPELYNPKRHDFNIFILGLGWDRERREAEELQAKMKSQSKVRTR